MLRLLKAGIEFSDVTGVGSVTCQNTYIGMGVFPLMTEAKYRPGVIHSRELVLKTSQLSFQFMAISSICYSGLLLWDCFTSSVLCFAVF